MAPARRNAPARGKILVAAARGWTTFMADSRELIRLRSSQIAPNKDAAHPFDIAHGTDTGGYLSPREIVTSHAHDVHNYGYSSIAPSVFREVSRRWRAMLSDPERGPAAFSFVDIGAGKGRALLLASELPFRKIIGVELSAELSTIAQANIDRWTRVVKPQCAIHILNQDALQFCWPRTSLLVFLYNPFACELVEQLLYRLESAAKRGHASKGRNPEARPSSAIDILYVNPTCADVLSRRRKWVLLWTDRIDMDAADQLADPYGTTFDRVSCYRLRA
jgi:SAM-dependent methyltransferase